MVCEGPPQLMTSYTAADQIDMDKVVGPRDEKFHVDYKHKREIRKDIPVPEIDPRKLLQLLFYLRD